MKKNRLGKFSTVILILCLVLFIAGIISLFLVEEDATQSRIAFQMFETAVMMAIIFLPTILDRLAHIKVPHSMEVCFVAFGFCSLIMGDVADLYALLPWWDALLHTFSGVLLGIVGFSIINMVNSVVGEKFRFPAAFVAVCVTCFALAAAALWEAAEYIVDGLFGLNSQQYLSSSGTFDNSVPLVGHEALKDTMEDLMLDLAGSVLIGLLGYFEMTHGKYKKWITTTTDNER